MKWYKISYNIIIADCDPNEHVNAILKYGPSEAIPDWTVVCYDGGYVCYL